jgi:ubiquinone/menaquinone biosynthesis C-methylase UbiE
MIDYDLASITYDNTRDSSLDVIELLNQKIHITSNTKILDYGCGTGNYLFEINKRFGCHCHGLEPSDGMREKAILKNPTIEILKGDHTHIDFQNNYFDLVYMTDVIHHVPDLDTLLSNLMLKIKSGGFVCIVTESHRQLETRWYNKYFPSLITNEKKRYPDIPKIEASAIQNGFVIDNHDILLENENYLVSQYFIQMVEEKNYSMFRQLSDKEYGEGLQKLKLDLNKVVKSPGHGDTLVWLKKPDFK